MLGFLHFHLCLKRRHDCSFFFSNPPVLIVSLLFSSQFNTTTLHYRRTVSFVILSFPPPPFFFVILSISPDFSRDGSFKNLSPPTDSSLHSALPVPSLSIFFSFSIFFRKPPLPFYFYFYFPQCYSPSIRVNSIYLRQESQMLFCQHLRFLNSIYPVRPGNLFFWPSYSLIFRKGNFTTKEKKLRVLGMSLILVIALLEKFS